MSLYHIKKQLSWLPKNQLSCLPMHQLINMYYFVSFHCGLLVYSLLCVAAQHVFQLLTNMQFRLFQQQNFSSSLVPIDGCNSEISKGFGKVIVSFIVAGGETRKTTWYTTLLSRSHSERDINSEVELCSENRTCTLQS